MNTITIILYRWVVQYHKHYEMMYCFHESFMQQFQKDKFFKSQVVKEISDFFLLKNDD